MDVDASLRYIGLFGRVQNANWLAYALTVFPGAFLLTGVAFIMGPPKGYHCRPPAGFSANQTVPGWGAEGPDEMDGCHLYKVRNGTVVTGSMTGCVDGWVYDTDHGETSIVTDLDLVCDKELLGGTLMSSIPLGILVGSYIIGQISDTFGRRPALLISLVGMVAFGIAMSFTWNYYAMFAFGFLLGCFMPGILIVRYVRVIEMYTPNLRLKAHTAMAMPWCLGLVLVGPLAYLLVEWRYLQIVATLPCLFLLLLVWYSYESIRWLVQRGRVDEAETNLQVIAASKNVSPPGGKFLRVPSDIYVIPTNKTEENEAPSTKGMGQKGTPATRIEAGSETKFYTVLDLLKTRRMFLRSMVVFYCWFTSNFVYYGFIINITNLAGDKYLNFFLMALTEIPCFIFDYFIIRRFGRRRPLVLFYLSCGVACLVTAFTPRSTASGDDLTILIVCVALFGKFFITAAFDVTYLVTAEVFPTVLRNIGAGSASLFGRIGGIVAPFVVYLNVIHRSIPLTVFGLVSLVAGLLVLTLPETHNKPLPETLEDGARLSGKD